MDVIVPGPEETRLAAMLKALGHPLRLSILAYVAANPGCIGNEIVLRTRRAQSTISQHLHVLQESGLLEALHDGHTTSYYLDPEALSWMLSRLEHDIPRED